uniref:Putative secreted protein n=1 Tax=Rhipicephalus microplus TaxID=6941 RepID=A0A6G5A2G5_RHIMP
MTLSVLLFSIAVARGSPEEIRLWVNVLNDTVLKTGKISHRRLFDELDLRKCSSDATHDTSSQWGLPAAVSKFGDGEVSGDATDYQLLGHHLVKLSFEVLSSTFGSSLGFSLQITSVRYGFLSSSEEHGDCGENREAP